MFLVGLARLLGGGGGGRNGRFAILGEMPVALRKPRFWANNAKMLKVLMCLLVAGGLMRWNAGGEFAEPLCRTCPAAGRGLLRKSATMRRRAWHPLGGDNEGWRSCPDGGL